MFMQLFIFSSFLNANLCILSIITKFLFKKFKIFFNKSNKYQIIFNKYTNFYPLP